MKNETVFINCIPEDRPLAEQIQSKLAESGISAYLPDEAVSLQKVDEIVNKLASIRDESGIMLVLLSKRSLQDNLIISNTQYFCELTGRRRVLVICKVDDLSGDNAISFYYPRSSMVNLSQNRETGIQKAVINVKRLLGIEVPKIVLSKQLNRRAVTSWLTIIAIIAFLAGIGSFFYHHYLEQQRLIEAAEAAAQAPVVINDPFAGESIDQGLVVDKRSLPVYQATDRPEQRAPFHYEPAATQKRITFKDPKFENSLDYSVIGVQNVSIREEDLRSISQQNGVLHLAATMSDQGVEEIYAPVNHLFSLEDTSYVGIRFRLGDYQGWSDIQQQIEGYIGTEFFPIAALNFTTQTINLHDQSAFIGTAWHTLEAVVSSDRSLLQIYLDGEPFAQVKELPPSYSMNQLFIVYAVHYATDWVNLYIDEIVFGGDTLLKSASEVEDAQYHYSPEAPEYFNGFEDNSINQFFTEGDAFHRVEDGSLKVDFPQEGSQIMSIFEIPTQSIDQVNYYAVKYRVTQTPQKYWNYDGFLQMELINSQNQQESKLNIQTSLDTARYSGSTGLRQYFDIYGSDQNFQVGGWHTLEWVIFPSVDGGSANKMQYWFDQQLISERQIDSPNVLGDSLSPLKIRYVVSSGDLSFGPISIEIDEILSGYLPFSVIDK
jgi:hypothetical protein